MIHTLLDVAMLKTANAPLADGSVRLSFDNLDPEYRSAPRGFWASACGTAAFNSYIETVRMEFNDLSVTGSYTPAPLTEEPVAGAAAWRDDYIRSVYLSFDDRTSGDYTPGSVVGSGLGVELTQASYVAEASLSFDTLTTTSDYAPTSLGGGFGIALTTSY